MARIQKEKKNLTTEKTKSRNGNRQDQTLSEKKLDLYNYDEQPARI